MVAATPTLFFDFVDPLSFLMERELREALPVAIYRDLRRVPLELRPPPEPLLDPAEEDWTVRWAHATALAAARGIALATPRLVPWTRKAHELVLHAEEQGHGLQAHRAIFDAFLLGGEDIGRVDVLVELARGLGLDPVEAKAVLDVDRHRDAVAAARVSAGLLGVEAPPALSLGSRVLRGFHNGDALRTFTCSL